MENITIGQVVTFIISLSTFIGALTAIFTFVGKIYEKQVKKIVEPINNSLIEIDLSQCKNFLVRFLSDVEQGNKIDEVEKERAYEVYEHYTKIGGNSYIHSKWVKLMEERKVS